MNSMTETLFKIIHTHTNVSLRALNSELSLFLCQDMRSPRFAYKKQEQSKLEIVETLTKFAFPLSNDMVSHGISFICFICQVLKKNFGPHYKVKEW